MENQFNQLIIFLARIIKTLKNLPYLQIDMSKRRNFRFNVFVGGNFAL